MTDTYRDKEGRECARLRFETPPRTDSADEVIRAWRDWSVFQGAARRLIEWRAFNGVRVITAPTLAALRRKLVEEDRR